MPKLKPETLEKRRRQILEAALTCFARDGYHLATMDDVVREAGLSKGSLYTYFDSKKALFLTLLETMLGDTGLPAILENEPYGGEAKPEDALKAMLAFTRSAHYPAYASLLMTAWEESPRDEEVRAALASIYTRLRELLIRLIRRSVQAGAFRPVDVQATANIFMSVFDGLMVQAMLDPAAVDFCTVAATLQSVWRVDLS